MTLDTVRWLLRILAWRSRQSTVIRWLEALALFATALATRLILGTLYGGNPALSFYPVLLIVSVLLGWKEAFAFLVLSITAGMYLFLPPGMYLLPLGWLSVGGFTIAIIIALKTLAQELAIANDRQRLLFQELQHRVANTLQSVVGTLDAARRRIDSAPSDAKRILEEGVQRISASADVHRRLNDPALFNRGLKPILQDAVATAIDAHSTNISFDVEPLKLSFDQMSVITMIVIEISNNAQKHVFGLNLGSNFLVALRALPEARAVLSVKDDGPGWSRGGVGDGNRTLGMTLLQGLAGQLGGKLHVKSENGAEVSIIFPISTGAGGQR
jgi:two-component sensor histidine kinase